MKASQSYYYIITTGTLNADWSNKQYLQHNKSCNKALLNKNEGKSKQQYENKKYGITGSDALSYSQAAEILSKALGRKISYVNITEEDARKSMKNLGMEDLFVDTLIEICNVIKSGNASQTIGAVEQITGRSQYHLNNLSEIMLASSTECRFIW